MAWYKQIFGIVETPEVSVAVPEEEKFMPVSPLAVAIQNSREQTVKYEHYYEELEVVNRGVNMLVDDCASINIIPTGKKTEGVKVGPGTTAKRLNKLLNVEPNLYQDPSSFKRNILTDFLLDGNIFLYYDGAHLYHLLASDVKVHTDDKTFISHYEYHDIKYKPEEIIHIKENSFYSIHRGTSRLKPAVRTMDLISNMRDFQDNFFENGAVPGLVLKTPDSLSDRIKERMSASWAAKYNPKNGGKKPLILDGGMSVEDISKVNFRELDFQQAIKDNEVVILKALGIPPLLLDAGNNANIRPNMRMYYLETVLPILTKICKALERYFALGVELELTSVPALQPELRDQAAYYTTLVNGGVTTPNEGRDGLGLPPIKGGDELRIPANIAGSASNPSEGGKPAQDED